MRGEIMLGTSLIQDQLDKFGVVTVMDALLRDVETGQPLLFLDTLKITSINQEGEQKEIKGGIGANKLIIYDFGRTVTVEIQDALASIASLGIMWGAEETEGKFNYTKQFKAYIKKDGETNYVIDVPAGIVIDEDSFENSIVLDAKGGAAYKITGVEGQKLSINVAGATPDLRTEVQVFVGVTADTAEGAQRLTVKGNKFPPTVRLEGRTVFINQATQNEIEAVIEIPLLKINIGGGLTMEAEGDAAVFDFAGEALLERATKDYFSVSLVG